MDGAKDLHEKSLTLMDELGLKAEKAGLMARMGMDYHLAGDDREAIRLLNEALVMARQLGSKEEEPTILEGLASVWLSVGNELEARHFCERLNAIAADRGLKSYLAEAKRMKGEMILREVVSSQSSVVRWEKAETELKEAVKIARGIGALPILWQAHASLWELYEKKGDDKKASKQLSKAKEVIDQIASNISDSKLTESFLSSEPVTRVLAKTRK
jgi:tetratricopeptide (TPR) repeat protein